MIDPVQYRRLNASAKGNVSERHDFYELVAEYDAPAFVRRAQGIRDDWNDLVAMAQTAQADLLDMPKLRLATLAALTGSELEQLTGLIKHPDDLDYLIDKHNEWRPQLRMAIEPTRSVRKLAAALEELKTSFHRFNRRWLQRLETFNLTDINAARENYNRYYVIEKACALGSEKLAQLGFSPLEPLTTEQLLSQVPCLRVPR